MAFRIADAIEAFFREDFQDGDLVSWDWLTYHLYITPKAQAENQFLMLERVDDFRNELLKEHLIALQNVRGKGYRIVPPAEQAEYAARELAKYFQKGFTKAKSLLEHTRIDKLSTEESRRHTDAHIRTAALDEMVKRGKRDVFAVFSDKKKHIKPPCDAVQQQGKSA